MDNIKSLLDKGFVVNKRSDAQQTNDERAELILEVIRWQEYAKWAKHMEHVPTRDIRDYMKKAKSEGENPKALFVWLINNHGKRTDI